MMKMVKWVLCHHMSPQLQGLYIPQLHSYDYSYIHKVISQGLWRLNPVACNSFIPLAICRCLAQPKLLVLKLGSCWERQNDCLGSLPTDILLGLLLRTGEQTTMSCLDAQTVFPNGLQVLFSIKPGFPAMSTNVVNPTINRPPNGRSTAFHFSHYPHNYEYSTTLVNVSFFFVTCHAYA